MQPRSKWLIVSLALTLSATASAQPRSMTQEQALQMRLDQAKKGRYRVMKDWDELTPEERTINQAFLEGRIRETGKPRLEALIDILRSENNWWMPRHAIVAMGWVAVPRLRQTLGDAALHTGARLEALRALVELGDKEAVSFAEAHIPRESTHDVYYEDDFRQLYLRLKLEGKGEQQKIRILIDMLTRTDVYMGYLAREELIDIGSPAVQPLIVLLVAADTTTLVQRDIIWSLRFIGGPHSVPPLIEILSDDATDDRLRWLAAIALGDIGSHDALPGLISAAETWAPLAGNDPLTYNVREEALKAINKILRGERSPRSDIRKRARYH